MSACDKWWTRQLIENIATALCLYECFQKAQEPNVEDLDKAITIYEECCGAYVEMQNLNLEEFIGIGKSLRARQASLKRAINYDCQFNRTGDPWTTKF